MNGRLELEGGTGLAVSRKPQACPAVTPTTCSRGRAGNLDLFPHSPGEPQVGLSEVGPALVLFSALGAQDQSEPRLPPDFRRGTRKTAGMVMIGHTYNF